MLLNDTSRPVYSGIGRLAIDQRMIKSRATISTSTSGRANRTTIAGVIWICAAQFFVAQIVAQSVWTTPFRLSLNYISDLGNTTCGLYPAVGGSYVCSPWHTLMNISFVLQGIIILVGAVLARPGFAGLRWRAQILSLLVVTALGMVGVGLFPEDVNNRAHVLSAGTQFITGNAAMILIGIAVNRAKRWRAFSVFSITSGIAGLLATALFAQGYGLGLGVGGMERVAAYTLPVWLITAGVLIVRKCSTSAPPSNSFNRTWQKAAFIIY
jgi:hypothetical membrane protein